MPGIIIRGPNGETHFGVDSIPNRKSKFLYYSTNGVVVEPLAYFRNEASVEKFIGIMQEIQRAWESEVGGSPGLERLSRHYA